MSRCTSRYAACLLGLQATHTVIQSANPVKVPLQALTRQGVVLLALRTSCPQPDSLLVKQPRQIPHAISQKVQVPAYILEPLQAGLRILDASAKRYHVRPLAIQQSLTGLHTGEKALQVRTGASRATHAERPGRTSLPPRAPPPLLGNEGVLYYHVERLLKRHGRSGQYQYLVKWRGYPSSRNSWEPGALLEENCADLVASFDSVHRPGRR
ncbi:hypothetical protein PF001_g28696 [Phytophthora fragariae]|uniref:Chromo domain-containing protein n=1 Tax=Phytophthora fragariae TaxID=53985 RepID=A0A6A4B8G4_9STRA|nr:hypothetical protein PF003_g25657 [Phytophthora fragariae]KAE9270687.1 hypothetical protein PF001_g28696 [Phytophthora fragariae]